MTKAKPTTTTATTMWSNKYAQGRKTEEDSVAGLVFGKAWKSVAVNQALETGCGITFMIICVVYCMGVCVCVQPESDFNN